MDEICIYLNKHVKSTILVFALMGFTYLLLGISDFLKNDFLFGFIEISFALIALSSIFINSLPSYQFQLFYCIDKNKISIRTNLFQKTKIVFWESIKSIKTSKNEILLFSDSNKITKIRLSSMNYNELVFFDKVFQKYINQYKIEKI